MSWPMPWWPPSSTRAGRTSSMPAIGTTSRAPRKSMPTRARSCIRWACRLGAKPAVAEDAVAQIGWLATRLADAGIETFVLDLTRPRFAVPVVRVVAPGLQIEPSQLESPRLQRAIAATGGGHRHTGGVELF